MLKRIIIGIVIVFLLLLGTLTWHIYTVTQPQTGAISSMALSRIDLDQPIDDAAGDRIKSYLLSDTAIKDIRLNKEKGHIICLYDRRKLSPQEIISSLDEKMQLTGSLYQPSEEMLAQSCPAIDKNSITYKLGAFIQKRFDN